MPRVVLTAQVDDPASWEERYRSHADTFRKLWGGPFPDTHFTIDGDGVVMSMDVDDLEAYFEMLETPEIAEAMKHDGVKRDTVKVHVLDRIASF